MNYYIESHDMEIILAALEALHTSIKHGIGDYPWTLDEVDGLFQSFDNSGEFTRKENDNE